MCTPVCAPLSHQIQLAKESAAAVVGAPPPAHTLKAATQLQGQRKAGIIKRMQVVLFITRELLPMRLFPALMSLLVSTGSFDSEKGAKTGNMATDDGMVGSARAAHRSEWAGWQFLESLSWVSRRKIREEMADAPTIAATQDETLDCSNKSQQITFYVYPFQKMGSMIKVRLSITGEGPGVAFNKQYYYVWLSSHTRLPVPAQHLFEPYTTTRPHTEESLNFCEAAPSTSQPTRMPPSKKITPPPANSRAMRQMDARCMLAA